MLDHYRTLIAPSEFRQKIDRSEFLGIAFHVETEDAFFAELAALTKRHYDATHLCWAFRLFANGDIRVRSADAGEPSGTAGKPILSAIEGANLYDTAVIVVRWYGGVKLGTGGLSRAYRETSAEALRIASIDDRYVYQRFGITVPFDQLGVVYRLIDAPHVVLVAEHFGETNEFDFDVRLSRADEFAKTLVEKRIRTTSAKPA
ncbi:MAG TPA: YigZ family protein [Thermoanaerobaculia bacterium]|nr:YigZ family protein [Thermoanaerobaculia bacterium]